MFKDSTNVYLDVKTNQDAFAMIALMLGTFEVVTSCTAGQCVQSRVNAQASQ